MIRNEIVLSPTATLNDIGVTGGETEGLKLRDRLNEVLVDRHEIRPVLLVDDDVG